MSKEQTIEELRKRNIVAEYENGVVMVYSDTLSYEALRKILTELDYKCSHGLRPLSWKKQASV